MRPELKNPEEANRTLVRTMIEEVFNAGHPERLGEFWTAEALPEAESLHDLLAGAFPDLRVRIEDLIAEDDRVVARLTFHGTHRGAFQGIEPTGRAVRFTAIRIYRLAGTRITGTWANQDSLGLLQQLRAA